MRNWSLCRCIYTWCSFDANSRLTVMTLWLKKEKEAKQRSWPIPIHLNSLEKHFVIEYDIFKSYRQTCFICCFPCRTARLSQMSAVTSYSCLFSFSNFLLYLLHFLVCMCDLCVFVLLFIPLFRWDTTKAKKIRITLNKSLNFYISWWVSIFHTLNRSQFNICHGTPLEYW